MVVSSFEFRVLGFGLRLKADRADKRVSALAIHYCGELAKCKITQRCDADDRKDSVPSAFTASVFNCSSVQNMMNEEIDSGQ
jgi:hypothetical protein